MTNAEIYEKAERVIRSVDSEEQIPVMRNYFFLAKRNIPSSSVYWEMLWSEYAKKLNKFGMNYLANWDKIGER